MKNLNELIPIQENNGKKAVNARDLHSFLQVGKDFSTWIKGRINKYDFVEGKDFEPLYFDYQGNLLNIRLPQNGESENQQVSKIEYALSISMAKELSMLENNERGKQARKYFIACEENKRELSRKELLLIALQAEEEKERLAQEKKILEEKNAKLQPKADFADCIMQSNDCISVGEMANILKQNGLFKRGRNALYEWMRWNGYLLSRGARYNLPSQKSMSLGIMKIAESIQSVREQVFINRKAVITLTGRNSLSRHLVKGNLSDKGQYVSHTSNLTT